MISLIMVLLNCPIVYCTIIFLKINEIQDCYTAENDVTRLIFLLDNKFNYRKQDSISLRYRLGV